MNPSQEPNMMTQPPMMQQSGAQNIAQSGAPQIQQPAQGNPIQGQATRMQKTMGGPMEAANQRIFNKIEEYREKKKAKIEEIIAEYDKLKVVVTKGLTGNLYIAPKEQFKIHDAKPAQLEAYKDWYDEDITTFNNIKDKDWTQEEPYKKYGGIPDKMSYLQGQQQQITQNANATLEAAQNMTQEKVDNAAAAQLAAKPVDTPLQTLLNLKGDGIDNIPGKDAITSDVALISAVGPAHGKAVEPWMTEPGSKLIGIVSSLPYRPVFQGQKDGKYVHWYFDYKGPASWVSAEKDDAMPEFQGLPAYIYVMFPKEVTAVGGKRKSKKSQKKQAKRKTCSGGKKNKSKKKNCSGGNKNKSKKQNCNGGKKSKRKQKK